MASSRQTPNDLFRAARLRLKSANGDGPMSREEFADRVNAVLDPRDTDGPVAASDIGKIERGIVSWPRKYRRAAYRIILNAATDAEIGLVNRRIRPTDILLTAPRGSAVETAVEYLTYQSQPETTRPEAPLSLGLEFPPGWRDGVDVVTNLWKLDAEGRVPLPDVPFVATAFLPPAMRWLMSSFNERPAGHGDRLVGGPDIELIHQITATYRNLDNRFGGGHIREGVVRFLNGDVAELINGKYDSTTGRALLAAAAGTTQLAAWASYDVGKHGVAQRYLIQSLRLAAGAADRALGAEILAAMSHQAAYMKAPEEAVDLARAAGRVASESCISAIQAESAVLEAQGHAARGDESACATALDAAEKIFDKADRVNDPYWIGYFDEAYLAAKFGHCFLTLGRGDIAGRFAARSLEMDERRYARGYQFNLALLALAHAQTGEVEEACRVGLQAVEAADGLRSARAHDYLAELANRLGKHVGLPAVREFTDRLYLAT